MAPHPDFRNEWWYVTGNLADAQGRQFGYQLTLFRIAYCPLRPLPIQLAQPAGLYGSFRLN